MQQKIVISSGLNWPAFIVVGVIGLANLILVHPVPGGIALLISLVYLPPLEAKLRSNWNITIPPVIKLLLFIAIVWFTLGVSDLGDMIDG